RGELHLVPHVVELELDADAAAPADLDRDATREREVPVGPGRVTEVAERHVAEVARGPVADRTLEGRDVEVRLIGEGHRRVHRERVRILAGDEFAARADAGE